MGTDPEILLAGVWSLVEIVPPRSLAKPVSRDPDDDAVSALAEAARLDLIVSGDPDLLVLGNHAGIPIVTAAMALEIFRTAGMNR